MRYGTVCSGVEAFGPAWEKMGYEPAFHAEIAPHPAAVLRYHYPNVPNYGDFTQIEASPATRIDLLAGGTPCQDFSVAGLRKGLAGHRGNLTLEFARLAERLRPRWLVWENVPGVLSADGGRAFGQFLTLLAECGYYAAYRVLDAQHFGVPQRRRRVFVVAYLGDWRPAAAVLFERHSLRGDSAPRREQGQELAGTLTAVASGSGPASRLELCVSGYLRTETFGGGNTSGSIEVATCLTGSNQRLDFDHETFICATGKVTHALTAEGHDASEDGTGRGTPIITAKAWNLNFCDTNGSRPDRPNGGLYVSEIDKSGTLTCADAGTPKTLITPISSAVRRLTPRECERLMGYPDDWTRFGVKPNGTQYEVADGPRYQMCGNGWATDVANWVGARVKLVDDLLKQS